ncbi:MULTISPECIES: hypothetical protein [Vibrio]|uniref:hypothetical protein n=1 Tax=Vibrio TaxID=662 RepID=UPI001495BAFA|nr:MULTISPECIES: hypothetical protein [Vibrio]USD58535.1 hypothetical protein J4N44_27970 [Vibrio sp. SCSIO 43155]
MKNSTLYSRLDVTMYSSKSQKDVKLYVSMLIFGVTFNVEQIASNVFGAMNGIFILF